MKLSSTTIKHQPTKVKQQLNELYQLVNKQQNDKAAQMIIDLYEKYTADELVLTFAGHFSAGKSSMINQIVGEEILPNSPIPTSANIVKIKAGLGDATVHFNDHRIVHYAAPYDIEVIKDFCTNKNDIHLVELSSKTANLPAGVTIIDTPGIDAADDYDRQLTEASLHLTDILFYMMDYNHVQSEVNLLFLQQLQAYNIPFYIIINQIDKHSPDEITFTEYKSLIKQTLLEWQLKPLGIYFTSLKDFSLKNNDFEKLKKTIIQTKNRTINLKRSLNHLIKDHRQHLQTTYTDKINAIHITDEEKGSFQQTNVLLEKITAMKDTQQRLTNVLTDELNQTLNNAYLMPYETRELARMYLESQQKDFKVGFFNRKQKTKLEQEKRLNVLFKTISSTIDRTITWSLREKFRQVFAKEQIVNQQINQTVQSLDIPFTKDNLHRLVHHGATVNGTYVLNYTKQITEQIKQLFKQSFAQLLEIVNKVISLQIQNRQLTLDTFHELKEKYEQKILKKKHLQAELNEQLAIVNMVLKGEPSNKTDDIIAKIINSRQIVKPENVPDSIVSVKDNQPVEIKQTQKQRSMDVENDTTISSKTLNKVVDQTIEMIENLNGFSAIKRDLQQKKDRLIHQQLTIALFGAFSAGKSSFANALMGEYILPSSPNPMTAAITKIQPVTKTKPHGTIIVTFKDEQTILNELLYLLDEFNLSKNSLKYLIDFLQDGSLLSNEKLNQMTQVYVQSIVFGYQKMKQYLGKQLKVSHETFSELATDETKASFVSAIDLYYSSELTDQGITLVDTPGADSIHARHTDLAFNYIKNADAIIYVTYYNHAFAKADKDFIMQLGRVKESFELDKMFFIVNAADLATDESELNVVVEHVQDELLNLGVRFPNIYPLSSKQALENKLAKTEIDHHMQAFERSFNHFIKHDLTKIVAESIVWDIKRLQQLFTQQMKQASLDHQAKKTMIHSLNDQQNRLLQVMNEQDVTVYENQVSERINRQLYYAKERFSIRYHDLFRDNFNPTTIKTGKHHELERCLKQLVSDTQFEWLREMQAISLRIETYLRKLSNNLLIDRQQLWETIEKQFLLPKFELKNIDSPEFIKGFDSIDYSKLNRPLRMFKGLRAFFEQRESESMKAAIYEQMTPYIEQYIEQNKIKLLKFYQKAWLDHLDDINSHCKKSINEYVELQITMLEEPIGIDVLKDKSRAVHLIINQIESGGVRE